ncbi:hypothetical protein L7F22_040868 [Adiantum nelumboides]|nr:hypothetical protein [Adiantum nelumboides]
MLAGAQNSSHGLLEKNVQFLQQCFLAFDAARGVLDDTTTAYISYVKGVEGQAQVGGGGLQVANHQGWPLSCPRGGEDKPALTYEEVKHWDADFLKVDQATLFDLILATNYLNIQSLLDLTCQFSLLDLTCQCIADMIKGKTPEEIRKTFNIKNDFTPEEEEEVRRGNQWAFE